MSHGSFNLASFTGRMKVLHLSWVAFFITFVVWFNFAPLKSLIVETMGLTNDQWKTLLILNVALTIPARVIIGALTDRYGPRIVYSVLLATCSIPCFMFAMADSFMQLAIARFMLGFIGAGFVVGIRMVSEWFPPKQLGTAEGIYGGWGNFGSAAAAFTLPTLALYFGGDDGWRYAVGITGAIALCYSVIYFRSVQDTPPGSTYFKPNKLGGLEVTSKGDFYLLLLMKLPMYLALAVLNWKLSPKGVALLDTDIVNALYIALAGLLVFDVRSAFKVNAILFDPKAEPIADIHKYSFKQVAVLNVLYFATFGSELAVVSMLPAFFSETFELSMATAGLLAGMYAFMNLMSRPGGGLISDKFGRKKTLLILTAGLAVGYFTLGQIDGDWPIWIAVAAVMACSFFVQSGEGAVFAVVPLIKRRFTGQIAGMTGAYGNVGAVTYLTVYSFVDTSTFFMVIACTAVVGFVALLFMREPSGEIAEINEDGSVELIKVH